jgi:3alpha(or 20beta)-hydroxysteroid dehydrogenase
LRREDDGEDEMARLADRIAIVTGAARGTGEAVARLFAAEGARVVIADVQHEAGARVAADIGGSARFARLDVTSETSWQELVGAVVGDFGRLDVLVNNAGVLHMSALEDTSLADYERVVRVNQIGPFLGMKSVAKVMKDAGRGAIVNVSSIDGMSAKNGLVAYSASKWAVRGMTRVAAIELGKSGIRVNAVCPEAGSAEMMRPYMPEGVDPEVASSYQQRILKTQMQRPLADKIADIAKMVLFLASDESASCTGADFLVDGGNLAGSRIKVTPGG